MSTSWLPASRPFRQRTKSSIVRTSSGATAGAGAGGPQVGPNADSANPRTRPSRPSRRSAIPVPAGARSSRERSEKERRPDSFPETRRFSPGPGDEAESPERGMSTGSEAGAASAWRELRCGVLERLPRPAGLGLGATHVAGHQLGGRHTRTGREERLAEAAHAGGAGRTLAGRKRAEVGPQREQLGRGHGG